MTDHKAEAERLVGVMEGRYVERCIAYAQVHALLYLAEQQRVANLIALGQFRIGATELPPLRHLAVRAVNEHHMRPTLEISRLLGLESTDD